MPTIVTTTRLWGSDDSSESINHRFRDLELGGQIANSKSRKEIEFLQKALNGRQDHQSKKIQSIQRKSGKSLSRTSILAVPKRQFNNDQISGLELNGVKKSALLYEITDRTNRLAKPKTIVNDIAKTQNPSTRISLPKSVSQRVSELSRPRTFYNPPAKPFGYVAPCALRAVATRRILELSTPRKTRSPRLAKKNVHSFINAPCSSRISYLARPKHSTNSRGTRKNFLKRSMPASGDTNPTPWKFPNTRVWKKLGYSKKVVRRCEEEYSSCRTRRKQHRRKQRLIKPSKSNDSVLSLSVKKTRKSQKTRRFTKKLCFGDKMYRRKCKKF